MADAYCINSYRQKKYDEELKLRGFDNELLQRVCDEYLSVREETDDTQAVCLANLATAANRKLSFGRKLMSYDETRVTGAKAVSVDVEVNHARTPWLLIFKDGKMGIAPSVNIRLGEKINSDSFEPIAAASNVLMPYGGINQLTPAQAHVHKVPVENGNSDDCTLMARGCNAELAKLSPYKAAYLSVVEAVSRLVASGATTEAIYLSFYESYKTNTAEIEKYGKSIEALLGAFEAQLHIGVENIGVENAMSGMFDPLETDPLVVTYAVTMGKTQDVVSPEFKKANHDVVYLKPFAELNNKSVGEGLPAPDSLRAIWHKVHELIEKGMIVSACTPTVDGIAAALKTMSLGNDVACRIDAESAGQIDLNTGERDGTTDLSAYAYGGMILELADKLVAADIKYEDDEFELIRLGRTYQETRSEVERATHLGVIEQQSDSDRSQANPLTKAEETIPLIAYNSRIWTTTLFKAAKPRVVVPIFPGTNSGLDTARVLNDLGAEAKIIRVSNKNLDAYRRSMEQFNNEMKRAHMLIIPGRYSYGREFDDSLEFMLKFFELPAVREDITELLARRDGLICGMGTGFQFLLNSGLIMHGEFRDEVGETPELAYGSIDCTWPRVVRLRISSNASPWLRYSEVGSEFSTSVSYGDGRVTGSEELLKKLAYRGQVATQYVDIHGDACYNDKSNPFNSMFAIEGLTSPDGRIFGKMGHAERYGNGLYKNVPGEYDLGIFRNAMKYFK